jgi:hypothetical protein
MFLLCVWPWGLRGNKGKGSVYHGVSCRWSETADPSLRSGDKKERVAIRRGRLLTERKWLKEKQLS